jgi:tartrate dehydratase alpha subunit/fumarate hydratase class I-like protein
MIGMHPKVHKVASVKPASIMILVSPSCSAERTLGAKMIMLKAPIAKPNIITMVD